MYALLVEFSVHPGRLEDFDRLTASLLPELAQHEPATLVYLPMIDSGDPSKRFFIEVYRDEERFLAERAELLAEPPAVRRLDGALAGSLLRQLDT